LSAVLIEGVQADQRIKKEKPWLPARKRCVQALLVAVCVEAKARLGDDQKVEVAKLKLAMAAEGLKASPHLWEPIFCKINKSSAGCFDRKVIKRGSARSDAQGKIEPKPALQRLSRSTDETDSAPPPEISYKPAFFGEFNLEIPGIDRGQFLVVFFSSHGQRTFRAETTWFESTMSASAS
jgi:hypothetical protein